MVEKVIYKHREIYKICGGSQQLCSFDFSSISFDEYEGLFNGLPNIVYKKAEELRFSRDLYVKRERADEPLSESEKRRLSDSIAINRDRFEHYLFKILNQTLPRSKGLKRLVISGLNVPTKYFRDFIPACAKCKTLRKLTIENVNILDDIGELIFKHLSPYRLEELSLIDCNLSATIFDRVSEYLTYGAEDPRIWRLKTLNLSENLFAPEQTQEIARLLKWRKNQKPPAEKKSQSTSRISSSHHRSSKTGGSSRASQSSSRLSESESHLESESTLESSQYSATSNRSYSSSRHGSHASSRTSSHASSHHSRSTSKASSTTGRSSTAERNSFVGRQAAKIRAGARHIQHDAEMVAGKAEEEEEEAAESSSIPITAEEEEEEIEIIEEEEIEEVEEEEVGEEEETVYEEEIVEEELSTTSAGPSAKGSAIGEEGIEEESVEEVIAEGSGSEIVEEEDVEEIVEEETVEEIVEEEDAGETNVEEEEA
jgi:hypothetical protein